MPLLITETNPLRGVWQITENSEDLLMMLGNAKDYLPQLEVLHTESRRCEWLACRVLLQELLKISVLVDYDPQGAPYMKGSSCMISFSHTKGFAAVVVDEDSRTGVDIEYRSARVLKVRDRFMHEEELCMIDPEHETEQLQICWCAKEALFKMLGRSGVDFREDFRIHPFSYADQGVVILHDQQDPSRKYTLCYEICPQFVWIWNIPQKQH